MHDMKSQIVRNLITYKRAYGLFEGLQLFVQNSQGEPWFLLCASFRESVWNATFNRPMLSLSFPLRFFLFWFWELFLTPERDSVLFDSPLSTLGIAQAAELRSALRSSSSVHAQARRPAGWSLPLFELSSVYPHVVPARGEEGPSGRSKQHCDASPELASKCIDSECEGQMGKEAAGPQAGAEADRLGGKAIPSADATSGAVPGCPEFSPRGGGTCDMKSSRRPAERGPEGPAQVASRVADATSSQAKAAEDREAFPRRQKSEDGITRRDKALVGKNRPGVSTALSAVESRGLEAAPAAGDGIVLASSNLR